MRPTHGATSCDQVSTSGPPSGAISRNVEVEAVDSSASSALRASFEAGFPSRCTALSRKTRERMFSRRRRLTVSYAHVPGTFERIGSGRTPSGVKGACAFPRVLFMSSVGSFAPTFPADDDRGGYGWPLRTDDVSEVALRRTVKSLRTGSSASALPRRPRLLRMDSRVVTAAAAGTEAVWIIECDGRASSLCPHHFASDPRQKGSLIFNVLAIFLVDMNRRVVNDEQNGWLSFVLLSAPCRRSRVGVNREIRPSDTSDRRSEEVTA